jgi:hypothetical protein
MLILVALGIAVIATSVGLSSLLTGSGTASNAQINEVKVVVNYYGEWSGWVNDTSVRQVNGTGPETFYIFRSTEGAANGTISVSACVYVTDDNIGSITVSIEKMDGTIIETSSASEIGTASVNWND